MGGMGANLRQVDFSNEKLPAFEKNFYIEHPDVTKRSEEEVRREKAPVDFTLYIIGGSITLHQF